MGELLEPTDVIQAADTVTRALAGAVGADWSVRAGSLDWDVRTTVIHAASATAKYSLCLSAQTRRRIALRSIAYPDANPSDLLIALGAVADSLAQVAATAPPDAQGFHLAGMADAEGFVAMACAEILIHGSDVAAGLGLELAPPDDLCRRVAARLFPWAPGDRPGWDTLAWATGRIELPGLDRLDSSWIWHCAPLVEWDGAMPKWQPVTEWVWNDQSRKWQALLAAT
ncbi:MAG: maleylpyruvate isomerase mycothiol-dependent enzyme family protein [Acidimicrobiales bacterium]